MDAAKIEPGAVFQLADSDSPVRVLLHDDDVVMYDAWWPHLGAWGLSDLSSVKRQRRSYYVITASTLLAKGIHVRRDPLSAAERGLHRPDLPFTALRDVGLSWTSDDLSRISTVGPVLNAPSIYLLPSGPAGGSRTGARIVADDGACFTAEELFRKAQAVQARHVVGGAPPHGIGIYRSGLLRGLPTYYLAGPASRLHENTTAHRRA